jgi:Tfp pilus assembly PilM family ATPase
MNMTDKMKFKGEHAIGLDINQDRIVATHFIRTSQGLMLDQLAVREYASGSSDKDISKHIRELWKSRRFSTHTVCSCIQSHAHIVRYFHYNNLTRDELPKALALEAEESLQLPPDEIVMDWCLNKAAAAEGSQTEEELSGVLVAVPRQQVLQHINLLKAGGVYPVHIEVSCSALTNLCQFMAPLVGQSAVCLINLAERSGDIVILSNGESYPRTLFSVQDRWEDHMEYLLENIKDALLYYHLRVKKAPVKKILLTGRMPALPVLVDRLAKATALPVEVPDLCSDPRLAPAIRREPAKLLKNCNLVTGLGLGLRKPQNEY